MICHDLTWFHMIYIAWFEWIDMISPSKNGFWHGGTTAQWRCMVFFGEDHLGSGSYSWSSIFRHVWGESLWLWMESMGKIHEFTLTKEGKPFDTKKNRKMLTDLSFSHSLHWQKASTCVYLSNCFTYYLFFDQVPRKKSTADHQHTVFGKIL